MYSLSLFIVVLQEPHCLPNCLHAIIIRDVVSITSHIFVAPVSEIYTVEAPITDPPKGGQPPYSGQSLWHGLKSLQL